MNRNLAVLPNPAQWDPNDRSLWTIKECGEFLHLTSDALYKLVSAGDIPVVRWGRNLRFRPASVRAWVMSKEAQA